MYIHVDVATCAVCSDAVLPLLVQLKSVEKSGWLYKTGPNNKVHAYDTKNRGEK